jgi:CrcB protein
MKTAIVDLVYIGLGGFVGSIGRYLASGAVHQIFPNVYFPIGTAAVNIVGCFLIGILTGLAELRNLLSGEMRMFLLIGLLGGFTTFSSFGHETVAFMRDGEFLHAAGNVLIQVIIGLLGVWLGYNLTR